MDVCLCEPFLISNMLPTLAPAELKTLLETSGFSARVFYPSVYFNMDKKVKDNKLFLSLVDDIPLQITDWLFYEGDDDSFWQDIKESLPELFRNEEVQILLNELRRMAQDVVVNTAQEICKVNPKLVSFSITFGGFPYLSRMMKEIHKIIPELPIAAGGSSCVLSTIDAVFERLPDLSYICLDESGNAIIDLASHIINQSSLKVSCIVQKGDDEIKRDKLQPVTLDDMENVAVPDFSDFMEIALSAGYKPSQLTLPLEMARGCWWCEKKPCIMCGFYGARNCYISKTASRMLNEIKEVVKRTGVHKFRMADLVQPKSELLEEMYPLCESGLHFFWEIRPDISERDLYLMRAEGTTFVQVGIESLSTSALLWMNKGTTGVRNLWLLVLLRKYRVETVWNYLYGLPVDKPEWYEKVIEIIPFLYHLQPPMPRRMWINSYSELSTDEDKLLTFKKVKTSEEMEVVYQKLVMAIQEWRNLFFNGAELLIDRRIKDYLSIVRRDGKNSIEYRLEGLESSVYEYLNKPAKLEDIARVFFTDANTVQEVLDKLIKCKLVLLWENYYIALAVDSSCFRWTNEEDQPLH